MIWEIDDGERAIEGLDDQGRPDPAYAQSLGLVPARRGSRVLAALLEWMLALVITLPVFLVVVPAIVQSASDGFDVAAILARDDLVWIIVALATSQGLMTAYVIVQLVLHGRKGVTLGKAVVGIRSVNVRTLERPGFWRGAVVRYLVAYASFIIPLIGPLLVVVLSPLFDVERRGRGWLDLAAATWFVDVRRGLNPYDLKRMRIARKRVKTPEVQEKAPLPSLATPIDRDAPAEYTPSARLSGGVLGAHRAPGAAPAVADASPADAAMVSAVPPSLATGAAMPSPSPALGGFAQSSPEPAPVAAPSAAPPSAAPPTAAATPQPAAAAPAAAPFSPPAPAPQPAAPAPEALEAPDGVRAVLVLDSGQRIDVRGVTLLGRSPAAEAGEGMVQLVRVEDDTLSVSKTHLSVMPARRGVFVVDRGSTNGSAILRDGAEFILTAGQPVVLQPGDAVRFGDRTLQVERV